MNSGGEPERDEPGLPPVDIEIPDDARELDRDVEAYYRELRAVRRRERHSRWHRSLGRDGILLPLLACCLILALITGTLLTVFTATSDQDQTSSLPGSVGSAAKPGGLSSSAPVLKRQPMPSAAKLTVAGQAVNVAALHTSMLVLVPTGCDCSATLAWLAGVATAAHAKHAYLVYTGATKAEVQQLYDQPGSRALTLAEETDATDVLTSQQSFPPGISAKTLTAVLVGPGGTGIVTYASHLKPGESQAGLLRAITGLTTAG